MSDKRPNASWMFSKKAKEAVEERERKQREYRLGSDNFTWEEVDEEDAEAEAILDEDADSRASRSDAAPVAAKPRADAPPTRCFDWMFSTTAKNARKRREEEALQRKNEVKVVVDDDSEESNNDIQMAILQSIRKESMEVTHVRVQQPEQDLVDKLFEDEAQNVPTNTPVNDNDSMAEATGGEEPTPEIPDEITEEEKNIQRVIMESLQQQIKNAEYEVEQLARLPATAPKPLQPWKLFERNDESAAQSVHENKDSLKPEPMDVHMETSINLEQQPDADDIEKNNVDAEENAPKNEDSSKPASKDVQLEDTVVKKERTTSLIDECIDQLIIGKAAESDTSAINEDDMLASSDVESLYVSGTDDDTKQTDEDDDKRIEEEGKHVE